MSEIEIILSEKIDSDLGSRNKIEELYQFEIVEINVPNEVQEMFNIILKLNGHL